MAESNFATKLQALTEMRDACTAMGGYSPSQSAIQVASMTTKVNSITSVNSQIAPLEDTLNTQQEQRFAAVHNVIEKQGNDGLIRRSRLVANYVQGLGTDFSPQYEMIRRAVNKMSPKKTRRKSTGPDDKTRSTSQQSFDSICKFAEDIFAVITAMGGSYAPVNADISAPNYQASFSGVRNMSSTITSTFSSLKPLIKERSILYNSKATGVQKVIGDTKRYVLGMFGKNSAEYQSIKHIKG